MKANIKWILGALALVVITLISVNSLTADKKADQLELLQTNSNIYRPTITADTITNTEADTLTISNLLYSPWHYNWTFVTTQLSGTQAIVARLYESNTVSGTDWIQVDTLALSGSADLDRLVGTVTYGIRQRVILTGSGTQSTKYWIYPTYKKGL